MIRHSKNACSGEDTYNMPLSEIRFTVSTDEKAFVWNTRNVTSYTSLCIHNGVLQVGAATISTAFPIGT